MFNEKIFSQRLKDLRTSKKLTLGQLGQELGVVKQTIGHWENEVRVPSLEAIISLADYFCVSIDYLTGRTDTPYCEEYLFKIEKELLRHMPYNITAKYKEPALRKQHYSIEIRLEIIRLMRIMVNDAMESAERYQKNMKRLEPGVLNDAKALINYGLEKTGLRTAIYEVDHDERNRQIKISQDLHNLLNNVNE